MAFDTEPAWMAECKRAAYQAALSGATQVALGIERVLATAQHASEIASPYFTFYQNAGIAAKHATYSPAMA